MSESCRLYLITPPVFELGAFALQLREAFEGGDVACLQLRMKGADGEAPEDALIIEAAETLIPICHEFDVQFILNDNPALAKEIGADGVHVGEDDGSVADARAIVGDQMVLGCSCYDSTHRAMEAGEQDADYVAFGAFYETKTKLKVRRPSLDILENWSGSALVPCVAIGGIKPDNLAPLVKAGADFIAVVTGVWDCPGGSTAAVRAYNDAIGSC